MYHWLKFGRKVLLNILSRDPDVKVSMPTNDEVRFYRESIGAKYLICDNVWAVADILKLLIQEPTEDSKQNQLYNRWKDTHNINCVLFLVPMAKYGYVLLMLLAPFLTSQRLITGFMRE